MRLASIDLGSNALTVTILEQKYGKIHLIKEWVKFIRLGQSLKIGGQLHPHAKMRCLEALRSLSKKINDYSVDKILAVGTAALRNANDGEKFIETIEKECGISFKILSGEKEAELTFKAITHEFGYIGKSFFMIDIGGGSTELVKGDKVKIKSRISLNVGTVSFSEKYFKHDPPDSKDQNSAIKELDKMFSPLSLEKPTSLIIGVAGTITTLKAVELKMDNYDPSRVHGKQLTLNSIIALSDYLLSLSSQERAKLKGLPHERADIIPMGALILQTILRKIHHQRIVISDHGLRWGMIYRWMTENL